MRLVRKYKEFELVISNDREYSLDSADNTTQYNHAYINDKGADNLSQHGILITKDEKVQNSAIVLCTSGITGVHETGCIVDDDKLLICCGDCVFSLSLPSLLLQWQTKADDCTCFEIVKHTDGYIVHGELGITRLNVAGEIVWSISGPDIFTTPDGKDTFKVVEDIVYAKVWTGITIKVQAYTGEII